MLKKRLESYTQTNDLFPIKDRLRGNPQIAVGVGLTTATQRNTDLGSNSTKHWVCLCRWGRCNLSSDDTRKQQRNGWKCKIWSKVGTYNTNQLPRMSPQQGFMGVGRWSWQLEFPLLIKPHITKWTGSKLCWEYTAGPGTNYLKENTAILSCETNFGSFIFSSTLPPGAEQTNDEK